MRAGLERLLVKRTGETAFKGGMIYSGVVLNLGAGTKFGLKMGPDARVWYCVAWPVQGDEAVDSVLEKDVLAWDVALPVEAPKEELAEDLSMEEEAK